MSQTKSIIYSAKYNGEIIYIGRTQTLFKKRHARHIRNCFKSTRRSPNRKFYVFWRSVGEATLQWEILEECDREKQREREQYYITLHSPPCNSRNEIVQI